MDQIHFLIPFFYLRGVSQEYVTKGNLAKKVTLATLVSMDDLVPLDCAAHPDQRVARDCLVPLVLKVEMVQGD